MMAIPHHQAEKAFPAMALFNVLRFPLAMFPQMISSTAEAVLSIERIRRFLDTPEVQTGGLHYYYYCAVKTSTTVAG